MKSIRTVNKVFILAIIISSFNSIYTYAQDSTNSVGVRKAKKAMRHNKKVTRLTYFVHNEDSIHQLFNVTLSEENDHVILRGWTVETNNEMIQVYQKLKVDKKGKKLSPEEKLLSNQAHISVKNFESENGFVTVVLDSVI